MDLAEFMKQRREGTYVPRSKRVESEKKEAQKKEAEKPCVDPAIGDDFCLPRREAVKPRLHRFVLDTRRDYAFYFAAKHRPSRLGRKAKRPSKVPYYKTKRRAYVRVRNATKWGI